MKKSYIITSVVTGLALLIAVTSAPALVGAQSFSSYGSYNARPYWKTIPNMTVVQGQTLSRSVQAIDENGDQLVYALLQAPQGATYNNATKLFTFTPTSNQLGSFPVTISTTDGNTQPVIATFYVTVATEYGRYVYGGGDASGYYNQVPYFSNTNSYYTASIGSTLSFYVSAIDPEGQTVRYSVNGLPAGASFNNENRQFTWAPITGQRGTYSLMFYATDGIGTSGALNVSIVVDGGLVNYSANNVYYPTNTNVAYNPSTYYPSYSNVGNYNANNYSGNGCFVTTPVTTAAAGQAYIYAARACDSGYGMSYKLVVAPTGATVDSQTGVVTWYVPTNANNQDYQFVLSATGNYSYTTPALQRFSVTVVGGTPTVTTVTNPVRNVVRYINAPATQTVAAVAPTVTQVLPRVNQVVSYYPQQYQPTYGNGQVVTVAAGRVVPPTNYQYVSTSNVASYGATAYGALIPTTAAAIDINTFNISVRVSADKQMIVSWDTNKPTSGEVVFGYSSQSRGPDLDRTILNYDFTTGKLPTSDTRHEANLGTLDLNRTYYLRVISRADNQTDISREIVFIPMTTQEGKIIVNQSEGAASAAGTLANFLSSGGFLFLLLLVVIALITYLIVLSRQPSLSRGVETNFNFAPATEFDANAGNSRQGGHRQDNGGGHH